MSKYYRSGALLAKDGNGDELEKILLEAAEVVSTIDGCRQYLIGRDLDNSDLIWVSEIWDSQNDHKSSLNNDKVKKLIQRAMPILRNSPDKGGEAKIVGGLELQ